MLETRKVQCPYCAEFFEALIDCSVEEQSYIEDCQVCCHPINFHVIASNSGDLDVTLSHEND